MPPRKSRRNFKVMSLLLCLISYAQISQAVNLLDQYVVIISGRNSGGEGQVIRSGHGFYTIKLKDGAEVNARAQELKPISNMSEKEVIFSAITQVMYGASEVEAAQILLSMSQHEI